MDLTLSAEDLAIQARARAFAETCLFPSELECEENDRLSAESLGTIRKAVQILDGRGDKRENAVERLYRDIRVDRIWEVTSEIQRLVIAGQIKKRGLGI